MSRRAASRRCQPPAPARAVLVWDVDTDESREVTEAEAAAGMMRYARSLGPGSAACGVWEERAVQLLRGGEPVPDHLDTHCST